LLEQYSRGAWSLPISGGARLPIADGANHELGSLKEEKTL
jgi:hypothetical protein